MYSVGKSFLYFLASISYATHVTTYFLSWFFFPRASLLFKAIPALSKSLSSPSSDWMLTFACYAGGDLFLEVSKGVDTYLLLGMSLFMAGHLIYLLPDKDFFLNYLTLSVLLLVTTTGIPSSSRALIISYFPILIRCLTFSSERDRDRVVGWSLFLLSDLLLAREMLTGASYNKLPLLLYWLGLDLL
jgi:hypothetical protein